jgi:hypothetical protein
MEEYAKEMKEYNREVQKYNQKIIKKAQDTLKNIDKSQIKDLIRTSKDTTSKDNSQESKVKWS